MKMIDMQGMELVFSGKEWTHNIQPCAKQAIPLLERNEKIVSWLKPVGGTVADHIPAILYKGKFFSLSLRMQKAIYRHIRLKKGFKNEEIMDGIAKLRIPDILLKEKIRTQSRFDAMRKAIMISSSNANNNNTDQNHMMISDSAANTANTNRGMDLGHSNDGEEGNTGNHHNTSSAKWNDEDTCESSTRKKRKAKTVSSSPPPRKKTALSSSSIITGAGMQLSGNDIMTSATAVNIDDCSTNIKKNTIHNHDHSDDDGDDENDEQRHDYDDFHYYDKGTCQISTKHPTTTKNSPVVSAINHNNNNNNNNNKRERIKSTCTVSARMKQVVDQMISCTQEQYDIDIQQTTIFAFKSQQSEIVSCFLEEMRRENGALMQNKEALLRLVDEAYERRRNQNLFIFTHHHNHTTNNNNAATTTSTGLRRSNTTALPISSAGNYYD